MCSECTTEDVVYVCTEHIMSKNSVFFIMCSWYVYRYVSSIREVTVYTPQCKCPFVCHSILNWESDPVCTRVRHVRRRQVQAEMP